MLLGQVAILKLERAEREKMQVPVGNNGQMAIAHQPILNRSQKNAGQAHPSRLASNGMGRTCSTILQTAAKLSDLPPDVHPAAQGFNDLYIIGIDDKNPGQLIDEGIFSLSRNPIFLSIDLYFLAAALLHSSWLFISLAPLVAVGIHLQILNEEKFLITQYGASYARYREKTPRYLIF
jgi:hypothetical protein